MTISPNDYASPKCLFLSFPEGVAALTNITFASALSDVQTYLLRAHPQGGPLPCVVVATPAGKLQILLDGDDLLSPEALAQTREELRTRLGKHAGDGDSVLMRPCDHLAPDLVLNNPFVRPFDPGCADVRLLDRLLTNQEWLSPLVPDAVGLTVPVGVGFSIKGGVGRTTALVALALHLARAGKRVAMLDLDLEAPGLGPMLLSEDQTPKYGALDWIVESLVNNQEALLTDDLCAPAPIARELDGDIFVIPACGSDAKWFIERLGRASFAIASPGAGEDSNRLSHRINSLLQRIVADKNPDYLLVDCRAGLHDLGAAAVARLGAQIFCFNRDERQTQGWAGYKLLFSHLRRSALLTDDDDDIRLRMKMVAAMARPDQESKRRWLDESYAVWNAYLYSETDDQDGAHQGDLFAWDLNDMSAPHAPLSVSPHAAIPVLDLTRDDFSDVAMHYDAAFAPFVTAAAELLSPLQDGA